MKNRLFISSFIAALFLILFLNSLKAQLPNGSVAPDFTVSDLNGNTHNLYNDLNNGYTVIIDLFATWCPPCWNYHNSNLLKDAYLLHGPNGDNTLRVYGIESDPSTDIDAMSGIGNNTEGDYVTGTPYPMINDDNIAALYNQASYPTVYMICPSGFTHDIYTNDFSTTALISSALQDPPCDGCALSTPIECETEIISNNNLQETLSQCNSAGSVINDPMRSFLLEGDGNTYVISTCGPDTDFDTKINVYEGDCDNLVCVSGGFNNNSNNCSQGIGNTSSEVTISTTAGVDYYVFITGASGAQGTFNLSVECVCPYLNSYELVGSGIGNPLSVNVEAQPNSFITMLVNGNSYTLIIDALGYGALNIPSAFQINHLELVEIQNQNCTEDLSTEDALFLNYSTCSAPIAAVCGDEINNSTVLSTVETIPLCSNPGGTIDLKGDWYSYMGDGNDVLVYNSDSVSNYVPAISLFTNDCNSLTCLSQDIIAQFSTSIGTEYLIYVSDLGNNVLGDYTLKFDCITITPSSCTSATSVNCGDILSDSNYSVAISNLEDCNDGNFYNLKGNWYTYIGDGNTMTVNTNFPATEIDTYLEVYSGDCSNLQCIGADNDAFTFNTILGMNYYIFVFNQADFGNYQVSFEGGGAYNFSTTPAPVVCGDKIQSDNSASPIETLPDCTLGGDYGFQGEWYQYIGSGEDLTISTNHPYTAFITQISVYKLDCGILSCVAEGLDMDATFTSIEGTIYYIHIAGGDLSNFGNYEVSFLTPGCSCSSPIPAVCGDVFIDSNINSEIFNLPDCAYPGSTYDFKGNWYSYVGDGNDFTISTLSSQTDFNTQISVYADCGSLICEGSGTTDATVSSIAGTTYLILVSGYNTGDQGTYEVSFGCGTICPPSLSLNATPEASEIYAADDYIESSSQINEGSNGPVMYQAGDQYIELKIGFEADGTVDFTAEIEDCDPGN